MTPYYADDWLTILEGDCREVMATMEPESVHCVVTSPPYWGLRDYGIGDKGIGLEPTPEAYVENMVAVFREVKRVLRHDGTVWLNIGDSYASSAVSVQRVRPDDGRTRASEGDVPELLSPDGAPALERSQPGEGTREGSVLPPSEQGATELSDNGTPAELPDGSNGAAWLEVPVLRRDDAGVPDARSRPERRLQGSPNGSASDLQAGPGRGLSAGAVSDPLLELQRRQGARGMPTFGSLKQKDLVGIPWMLAFALRADGWYLRSDVIWSKPNPMPESVTDRPTKAHEYLFLLSKSPRYYYDADAVREPHDDKARPNGADGLPTRHGERDGLTVNAKPSQAWHSGGQGFYKSEVYYNPAGRNLRSVWSIATQPYPGAHFATFPEKLVEPCILAGTSAKGVCPECGAPWVREVELGELLTESGRPAKLVDPIKRDPGPGSAWSSPGGKVEGVVPNAFYERKTTGWRSNCDHYPADGVDYTDPRIGNAQTVPATVLDPFAGSGTVGRVAARLSRRAVLIDLNAAYLGQAMERNDAIPLGLETA